MPTFDDQRRSPVPIDDFTRAASFVRHLAGRHVDIALEGATDGPSAGQQVTSYARAGMTWWVEALGWWRDGRAGAARRITAGPPAVSFLAG
jgi:hypothetical protein